MSIAISSTVRTFIASYIDSVSQLELLLFLQGHHERAWSVAELTGELRTNIRSMEIRLEELIEKGFVTAESAQPKRYRYTPGTPETAETLGAIADVYARNWLNIVDLIYCPTKKPIQEFADAFKLKPDGDKNG